RHLARKAHRPVCRESSKKRSDRMPQEARWVACFGTTGELRGARRSFGTIREPTSSPVRQLAHEYIGDVLTRLSLLSNDAVMSASPASRRVPSTLHRA